MARYVMTVVFDVHEDEKRQRRNQLVKKFLEKNKGKSAIWTTLKEQHYDPLQSDFIHGIVDRIKTKKINYRTTHDSLIYKLKEG